MSKIFLLFCLITISSCTVTTGGNGFGNSDTSKITTLTAALVEHENSNSNIPASKTQRVLPIAKKNSAYRLGAGDVLSIIVWEHPELTLPAGAERSATESGQRIRQDGKVFYPYIGDIKASGKTISQFRQQLSTKLAEFIPEPQLDVVVVAFNSQSVLVTGEVFRPQKISLKDKELDVLTAVNQAGGVTELADVSLVSLNRAGEVFNIDLEQLFKQGKGSNPVLRSGDVVHVAKTQIQYAYALGALEKQGRIRVDDEPTSIMDAITEFGGLAKADADHTRLVLIRQFEGETSYYGLDFSRINAMVLASQFQLMPGDILYVAERNVVNWNQVIEDLFPSVRLLQAADDLSE